MNEMNREMRRMSEREERLAKKADRNVGKYQSGEKFQGLKKSQTIWEKLRQSLKESIGRVILHCHLSQL